jgi:hypothetical protein
LIRLTVFLVAAAAAARRAERTSAEIGHQRVRAEVTFPFAAERPLRRNIEISVLLMRALALTA